MNVAGVSADILEPDFAVLEQGEREQGEDTSHGHQVGCTEAEVGHWNGSVRCQRVRHPEQLPVGD